MTPKEKALQLCQDFAYLGMESEQTGFYTFDLLLAQKCATIAVNELINDTDASSHFETKRLKFWNDVKEEIKNI